MSQVAFITASASHSDATMSFPASSSLPSSSAAHHHHLDIGSIMISIVGTVIVMATAGVLYWWRRRQNKSRHVVPFPSHRDVLPVMTGSSPNTVESKHPSTALLAHVKSYCFSSPDVRVACFKCALNGDPLYSIQDPHDANWSTLPEPSDNQSEAPHRCPQVVGTGPTHNLSMQGKGRIAARKV